MRGEPQKPRVVNRLAIIVAGDHDLHVVVEAGGGHAAEMLERANVFADGGLEVLRGNEPQILAAGIAQNVAKQVHLPAAFLGELDGVDGVVHLGLHAGRRFESLDPRSPRPGAEFAEAFPQNRVAAGVALPL